jgi:peptidoglycan/xylan/chitin deacetylase (PgdA/CDA1 family)
MQPRNVRGTGYNVTDWVGGVNRVSWAQLQEMYSNGWTIGNHTKAHIDLTSLSLDSQTTALLDARNAFNDHGLFNVDYVNYPMSGAYNADTLTAMQNLGMRTGQSSILSFNNVSPLARPFEIATRSIGSGISLATAEGWVNTALSHQEILVLTFNDITTTPTSVDWYIDRFQSLVDYCIAQGIPIITMDDLYRLQTSDITIPLPK